jgi:hypothetical protein
MATFSVTLHKTIRRPIEIVRAHFGDIRHHCDHDVHAGIGLEIQSDDKRQCRFLQTITIFGKRQQDSYVLERLDDGSVRSEAIEGPGKGSKTLATFEALDADTTEVALTLTTPAPALVAFFAGPLIRREMTRALTRTLEEDRNDLEVVGYPRSH